MEKPLTHNISPGKKPPDLTQYEQGGGYAALRQPLRKAAGEAMAAVQESNRPGRGGAVLPDRRE